MMKSFEAKMNKLIRLCYMIVTLEHMSSMCVTSGQTIGLDYVSEKSLGIEVCERT